MYLENINSPEDVKRLSIENLNILANEIRHALLTKLSTHGGHIGPNLGMVEATIALHYVFNSPVDKIVYDVSHQSYAHKMLTGRKDAFLHAEEYDEVTGYTNPQESKHDFFTIGHTSTSVSLACGLAKARDLKRGRDIIAVIGDGSLSGGEAYEGLSNAGETGTNLIVVVNDNEMSIAENHGGLYQNLKALRDSDGQTPCNFFKSLGLDYIYVKDGNDITALIHAFTQVKDIPRPVVVHIHTLKGKGYTLAETYKERFHWGMPFNLETGQPLSDEGNTEDYCNLTGKFLLEQMQKDPTVVAISSGTPAVIGFNPERRQQAGKQFVDVGIAEEHAVALASGIAANGGRPVYGVYSTFIQRCYDQLSQDLCINRNPAVISVFLGGSAGMNDETHLGFFDIPLISNIPNIVYLAPTCKEEYFAMLEWGIKQTTHPVAVRVPGPVVIESGETFDTDYSELNRYKITCQGERVAIIALGNFYPLGESVCQKLQEATGIRATLINPRYITGLDKQMLENLKANHQLVLTLEDGVLDGGFGEKIARYYGDSEMKVKNYGLKKEFADRFVLEELLKENHLTDTQITNEIREIIDKKQD